MRKSILFFVLLACSSFIIHAQEHSIQFSEEDLKVLTLRSDNIDFARIPASKPGDVTAEFTPVAKTANDRGWTLKFTASGKVFKDVSFANPQTGYIVSELGLVYRSTDGGDHWSSVMNIGFPYYWYGVCALTPDTVVISGFNNQGGITEGVVRWTYNGGQSWSSDIVLQIPVQAVGWLDRIHFFNADTGIVINSFSGGAWYTLNGGKDEASWNYVLVNPDMAWFSGNIDAQASGLIYASGMHLAESADFGQTWTSGPQIDPVFDGGVDFLDADNSFGWTGGGQISAPVEGWIHRTTDGGQSWSGRLQTFPYPIRALHFLDELRGWAVGGNLYDEAGGIYTSTDGGRNWNLEVSTFAEMFSMDFMEVSADSIDIWCVGSTGGGTGYTGKLYKTRIPSTLTGIKTPGKGQSNVISMIQNYPNPFSDQTTITYNLNSRSHITLKIYDSMAREIRTLVNNEEQPGLHSVIFDGSGLPSGIYYYRLMAGDDERCGKMLIRLYALLFSGF